MAISKEKLSQILSGRARELCVEDSRYSAPQGYTPAVPLGQVDLSYDDDYDGPDNSYNDYYAGQDLSYSKRAISESRMPENIKQLMAQGAVDTSSLNPSRSVLDSMPISKPAPRPSSPQAQGGVDYALIKTIVNECIKEALSDRTLNESVGIKTIGLSGGKIKIVDNKGNVFSGDLKKIGTTKQQ